MNKKILLGAGIVGGAVEMVDGIRRAVKAGKDIKEDNLRDRFIDLYKMERICKSRGVEYGRDKVANAMVDYMTYRMKKHNDVSTYVSIKTVLCRGYLDKKRRSLRKNIDVELFNGIFEKANEKYQAILNDYSKTSSKITEAIEASQSFRAEEVIAVKQLRSYMAEEKRRDKSDIGKGADIEVKISSITEYLMTHFKYTELDVLALGAQLKAEVNSEYLREKKAKKETTEVTKEAESDKGTVEITELVEAVKNDKKTNEAKEAKGSDATEVCIEKKTDDSVEEKLMEMAEEFSKEEELPRREKKTRKKKSGNKD